MTTAEYLVRVAREGMFLAVLVSVPAVAAALLVGFAVSLFQATTQIQEQTLSFVPKLVAVLIAEAVAAPWTGQQLVRFSAALFEAIPRIT
jgi:flagellar biosynthetic protein FliQ